MKCSFFLGKILRAAACSAALGLMVAASPFVAGQSSVPQSQASGVSTNTQVGDESGGQRGLSESERIALAKHNHFVSTTAAQAGKKPNILVIWGDDIGWNNPGAYNRGMMGYSTPNIDRVAKEGGLFTDWYGQQSCTAGRAAFITGQSPFRTGLLKVGLPGAKEGLSEKDPTIAGLLKNHGYMTAQYGKNHLGDRDEHLPY